MTPIRIGIIEGQGAVIRSDHLVAVLGEPVDAELIDTVGATMREIAADEAVRVLARLFVERELMGAAIVVLGESETQVFAVGNVNVETTSGSHVAEAEIMGLSASFPNSDLRSVSVGGAQSSGPSWQHFESGATRGAGIALGDPTTQSTQQPQPSEPLPPPAGEYQVVSLTGAADLSERVPLPLASDPETPDPDQAESGSSVGTDGPPYEQPVTVLGVLSPRGHFNHPDAKFCSRSGVKIGASQTKALVSGVRPPLGVATFDDGSTYSIQWDTVVGRDPEHHELVASQEAAPLPLVDEELQSSRSHLLLELRDWDLLVSDLQTANGTFIRERPDMEARRLSSGERVVLNSGAAIFLGGRSFVYHEHHVR